MLKWVKSMGHHQQPSLYGDGIDDPLLQFCLIGLIAKNAVGCQPFFTEWFRAADLECCGSIRNSGILILNGCVLKGGRIQKTNQWLAEVCFSLNVSCLVYILTSTCFVLVTPRKLDKVQFISIWARCYEIRSFKCQLQQQNLAITEYHEVLSFWVISHRWKSANPIA